LQPAVLATLHLQAQVKGTMAAVDITQAMFRVVVEAVLELLEVQY
jgi:hypothetical protein